MEIRAVKFFYVPGFYRFCTLSHFVLITSGVIVIPVRVHSGSVFGSVFPVYIMPAPESVIPVRIHPMNRSKVFIPVRKLIPTSCKRGTAVRSFRHSWESETGSACVVFGIQSNMASQSRCVVSDSYPVAI